MCIWATFPLLYARLRPKRTLAMVLVSIQIQAGVTSTCAGAATSMARCAKGARVLSWPGKLGFVLLFLARFAFLLSSWQPHTLKIAYVQTTNRRGDLMTLCGVSVQLNVLKHNARKQCGSEPPQAICTAAPASSARRLSSIRTSTTPWWRRSSVSQQL